MCNHERNTSTPDVERMDKACSYIHLETDRFSLSRFHGVCILGEMNFLCYLIQKFSSPGAQKAFLWCKRSTA